MEPKVGIEPTTYALARRCSEKTRFRIQNLATTGLGPTHFRFCQSLTVRLQHRGPAPPCPHATTSTEAARPRHLASPVRMLPASREVPVAITTASGSLSA